MKGIADGLAIKAFGMVHWNLHIDQGCLHSGWLVGKKRLKDD